MKSKFFGLKQFSFFQQKDRRASMCLLMLGLLLFVTGSASAQVPSVNGQIAYSACEPSPSPNLSIQCDIWVIEADGTGQTNITNTSDLNETNPAWSPDGAKIAFIEGFNFLNHLMVINADGTGSTVVTPAPAYQFSPSWSPGGTQIAIVRQLPGTEISVQFDIVVLAPAPIISSPEQIALSAILVPSGSSQYPVLLYTINSALPQIPLPGSAFNGLPESDLKQC